MSADKKESHLDKRIDLTVTIPNLKVAHAMMLYSMFEHMHSLGDIGSSREITVFADGDGDFRPKPTYQFNDESFRPLFEKLKKYVGVWRDVAKDGRRYKSDGVWIDSELFYAFVDHDTNKLKPESEWPAIATMIDIKRQCPNCGPDEFFPQLKREGILISCSNCYYAFEVK